MCGRVNSKVGISDLRKHFGVETNADLPQRYNHPPGTALPVIVEQDSKRRVEAMHWGLVPSWAKEKSVGYKMINARAEGIEQKPAFRNALKTRRCIIPVAGYYEWSKSTKQPYYFRSSEPETPLPLAGLWEHWRSGAEEFNSCTIVTVAANEMMEPIHHRMPCSLEGESIDVWLNTKIPVEEALRLLCPARNDALISWSISRAVNSPAYDGEDLLLPVQISTAI